jgi:hypothetical protein
MVNRDGSVSPDSSQLSQFQYGISAHPELRNPPSFIVDYTQSGEFKMFINQVSPTGARSQVFLDGKIVADQNVPNTNTNITISVNVPAGKHNITVDSVGSDWYSAPSFTFTNVFSALQTYALIGKSKTLGWTRSRGHTWFLVHQNVNQPQISDGSFTLNICTASATWKIEWWNTVTGVLVSTGEAQCSCPNGKCLVLTITVPLIDSKNVFDWGFKIYQ